MRVHAVCQRARPLTLHAEPLIGSVVSPIIARTRTESRAAREEIVFPRSDLRAIDGRCANGWLHKLLSAFSQIPVRFWVRAWYLSYSSCKPEFPRLFFAARWYALRRERMSRKRVHIHGNGSRARTYKLFNHFRQDAVLKEENKIFKPFHTDIPLLESFVYYKCNLLRLT